MTSHFEMDMIFHYERDSKISSIQQTIIGEYSKINELGTIEIPEESKEGMFSSVNFNVRLQLISTIYVYTKYFLVFKTFPL